MRRAVPSAQARTGSSERCTAACLELTALLVLVLHAERVALLAIAFGREGSPLDAMARGAGGPVFLGRAMPRLPVIQRLARLRKDLRVARRAVIVDALEVLPVSEFYGPVFAREGDHVRRRTRFGGHRRRLDCGRFLGRLYLRGFHRFGAFFLDARSTTTKTDDQHCEQEQTRHILLVYETPGHVLLVS